MTRKQQQQQQEQRAASNSSKQPADDEDHQRLSIMRQRHADRKIGTQSETGYFLKHYGLSAQSQCSESCWMMGFTLGYAFHRPHTTSSTSKVLLQRCLAATASSLASQFNHTIGIMKHTMGTRSTGHSSVMGPNTMKWWWYMHTTHVMWSLYWSMHSLMYTRGTPCVPTARQISTITSATTTAAVRMKTARGPSQCTYATGKLCLVQHSL